MGESHGNISNSDDVLHGTLFNYMGLEGEPNITPQ